MSMEKGSSDDLGCERSGGLNGVQRHRGRPRGWVSLLAPLILQEEFFHFQRADDVPRGLGTQDTPTGSACTLQVQPLPGSVDSPQPTPMHRGL